MKVIYARLQTGVHLGDVGDLGAVLPPPFKSLEDLRMKLVGSVLQVSFTFKGRDKKIGIPLANISIVEFDTRDSD